MTPFFVTGWAYCVHHVESALLNLHLSPLIHGTYVGLIPLAEGSGVDLDDGALDQGVRSYEFVIGGVVDLRIISVSKKF